MSTGQDWWHPNWKQDEVPDSVTFNSTFGPHIFASRQMARPTGSNCTPHLATGGDSLAQWDYPPLHHSSITNQCCPGLHGFTHSAHRKGSWALVYWCWRARQAGRPRKSTSALEYCSQKISGVGLRDTPFKVPRKFFKNQKSYKILEAWVRKWRCSSGRSYELSKLVCSHNQFFS